MRLIDAEALEEEIAKDITGGLNYRWYIQNAPTVDVLDKIRDEIEEELEDNISWGGDQIYNVALRKALEIIDKSGFIVNRK